MTAMPHPRYPNPTIREVICEVHFRLENGVAWDPSWYNGFFKQVEEQFPVFQPASVPVLIELTPRAAPTLVVPQVIRYQHNARNVLLQLSENRIVVNILPIYPGWKQVSEDIRYAWNKLCEVVRPSMITRIGLRYINGIERSVANETLDKWLVPSEYIPTLILRSLPGFSVQTAIRLDDRNRIQVMLGDQVSPVNAYGTFILDIDRIIENDMDTNMELLMNTVSSLHDDVWEVFRSAKGDNLERLLQGKLL